jgi:asparagine synthase (glutamine-hydrolysing)
MCGIAGELRFNQGPTEANWPLLSDLMRRRGPDDSGFWDKDGYCTLAFRRLSILDLSDKGHQPMVHSSGRYILVFNGEIYNFRELRRDLKSLGETFTSTGDAEVLLKALVRWDIDALKRLNGIFALAFYDVLNKSLLLARDHAGIKPLYLLKDERGIVFASQFNQILKHPWGRGHSVDAESLALYLRFGYIPAPFAMISDSAMLEPGCWTRVLAHGGIESGRYWEFPFPLDPTLTGIEAAEAVDEAVARAVRRQLVSDVPVGAFLSGGIDSPLVVAKMLAAGQSSLTTFTISTGETGSDESADASRYADELGVKQVIEAFTPERALNFLPEVIEASSEPFGDYSMFPTMLVCHMASKEFKVMLSGDGGDELFWGYPQRSAGPIRYASDFRMPYFARRIKSAVRQSFGRGKSASLNQRTIGDWYKVRHTCLKNGWLNRLFPDISLVSDQFDGFDYDGFDTDEVAQWLRLNEFKYHLTMVLLKVDRASMHCSQEVRVPLLDKDVIEVAARVDWQSCLSLDSRIGKIPLRQSLAKHVKHQSTAKRGFEAPMANWLRGPLREQFEDLVIGRDDFFGCRIDKLALRELYDHHLSGQADYAFGLWPLLSLALWDKHHLCDN